MSKSRIIARSVSLAAALAMTVSTLATTASAQPDPGRDGPPPQQGYDQGPPGDYAPPPGAPEDSLYREQGAPPPPQGYDSRYDDSEQARAEDEAYRTRAEDWAARYCYRRQSDNAAGGAIIGGVLGALLGSGIAGRGSHTTGALVGGAVGAMAGASIGASSTSPGCPPGFVVREDAPAFYYGGFRGGYVYAAPPGYRPWIWVGGRWAYRPYPYHRYWYREHRRDWR